MNGVQYCSWETEVSVVFLAIRVAVLMNGAQYCSWETEVSVVFLATRVGVLMNGVQYWSWETEVSVVFLATRAAVLLNGVSTMRCQTAKTDTCVVLFELCCFRVQIGVSVSSASVSLLTV